MTQQNKVRLILGPVFLLVVVLRLPVHGYAHGVRIAYRDHQAVEILASYDTGEPMAGAQVSVYAPGDPSTPWLSGVCDEEGRFSFIPDVSQEGTWSVQVRQAGHGGFVHIPISESSSDPVTAAGAYDPLQIVLMAVCVVWGCVGTAFYFTRRIT